MASRGGTRPGSGRVRVLDHDPDLAAGLGPHALEVLRPRALARVLELPVGPWAAPTDPAAWRGHLGLLVLEGALTRELVIAGTACAELVGVGDVLRPWDALEDDGVLPGRVEWEVLSPVRIAVLDRDFTATIGRVPELTTAIVSRSVRRARWIALHLGIRCLRRIDARLLVLLWHLAGRLGRVTPRGVVVPLDLTHARLASLVGARRPSVTTALGDLAARGLVTREDGTWLLTGDLTEELSRLGEQASSSR